MIHVGFISTRLAGMDGVSMETDKWAQVFEQEGFQCFYMAGELDSSPSVSLLAEELHFNHPDIKKINQECFDVKKRNRQITAELHRLTKIIKDRIYEFIDKFKINLLVPQNALAIPMNIPLGVALTEVICETGIKTIAHHHDFFWERKRFLNNAVWDYLNMCFPPHLPSIEHVVINSSADNQLSLRTGVSATIIPNVMDFESQVTPPDEYAADAREALGIEEDELLILQPTRVVKRKGIELAIELLHRLKLKAKLVISHASGDEGHGYEARIREYSKLMGVNTIFVSDIIDDYRGRTPDGRKIYALSDIYPHADLVTYPSNFEGFGNAFLETIYYRKPIVVNNYSIYSYDIKPKGFKVIEMDGYVTSESVDYARQILNDSKLREEMVNHNYALALRYYSYKCLRYKLCGLISDCFGLSR